MSLHVTRILSVIALLTGGLWSVALGQDFTGGTGQAEDPYQIGTVEQLMALAADPNLYDKHFVLVADLDLAGQVYTTAVIAPDRTQFDFVYEGTPFTGTFDGAEHEIANLTVDIGLPANGFDWLGLFGSLETGAVIKNLTLTDVSIVGGTNSDCLGALVGDANNTTIDNCHVTGQISSGLNAQCVGGLAGWCKGGAIRNCSSACTVTGAENSSLLGGLVGTLSSTAVTDCVTSATVQGSTQSAGIGGLIGTGSDITVSDCRSDSLVSGGVASHSVGGLIGSGGFVTLQDCSASQAVSAGAVSYRLGGLAGALSTGVVTDCHSAASVAGDAESYLVGGLLGYGYGVTVTGCSSTGPVSAGTNSDYLGGLVGLLDGSTTDVWAAAKVVDSYSDSSVTGQDNSDHIGGLVGENDYPGKIYRSHATGAVHGEEEVGGLVGWNRGTIVDCHATGDITTAIDADRVGGLVGRNRGHIHASYATGSITGDYNSDHLGGLVGKNEHWIVDCYATGAVSGGQEAEELGGLVGFNEESSTRIRRCYSTGAVTSLSDADSIGAFVGYHRNGYILECFWDIDASEMDTGIGVLDDRQDANDVTGLTTAQMQDPASFEAWGFADAAGVGLDHQWVMAAGDVGPALWWQRAEAVPLPTFSGGSGTADDPYLIADLADLNRIACDPRLLDKHYQLVADLDLTGEQELKMIGDSLHPFTGTFDGNGYAIDNIVSVTRAAYEDLIGVFGVAGPGGVVRNLTLSVGLSVDNASVPAVGGLMAYANQATVRNCHVAGRIEAGSNVGGLIGVADNALVTDSRVSVEVSGSLHYIGGLVAYSRQTEVTSCQSEGTAAGRRFCGGLIGYMDDGRVTHSANAASVTVDVDDSGGLVGHGELGEIAYCYNTGTISGDYAVGGIIGNGDSTQIRFTYNTGQISGEGSVGGLAGRLHDSQVLHSYSVGAVIDTGSLVTGSIGGLVGGFRLESVGCFWDVETSGQADSDGGEGLSTAEMMDISTYLQAGWDFVDETDNGSEDIWFMPDDDYPHLAWEIQD